MSLIRKIGFEKYPKVSMLLMAHGELFLLQVILIGLRLFTIPILKFQSKNRLELEEQKRNPLKLSTSIWTH